MNRELVYLKRLFLRRAARLRRRLGDAPHRATFGAIDPLVASVILDLANSWSEFSRSLYFMLVEQPVTCAGVIVKTSNATVRSRNDAAREIIRVKKKWVIARKPSGPFTRIDEPSWIDPVTLVDGVNLLGASNALQVSAALSNPKALVGLRSLRNFYAHRNESTARNALKVGPGYTILGVRHPTSLALAFAYGRPQPLVFDLIDEISQAVGACCL